MHVIKVEGAGPGEPAVRLVDDHGGPVAEVDGFFRLLTVREYSPNTVRAYAHDLQKLFAWLGEAGSRRVSPRPARAMEFLQWLRLGSSSRRAHRLKLGVATEEGRVLSPKTCNRIMAAVSSFYEFLIASEQYAGRDNPIVKVADQHREDSRAQEPWYVDDLREHLRSLVLADYQSVLQPGAVIAGPLADSLSAGQLE
ncbi:MAG TPA: site-specific integrase [Streptosporangiaceae bacterium]|nr:site-specific integrase [Streptosporangiaceae bacterium]